MPRSLFQLVCAASLLVWWSSCQDWWRPPSTSIATTSYLRSVCLCSRHKKPSRTQSKCLQLTQPCCVPLGDPRRQLLSLPGHLRRLGVCASEGPARTRGECWHLPWRQLRTDQRPCASLRRQWPRWYHPRLSEGKLRHHTFSHWPSLHILVINHWKSVPGSHSLSWHRFGQMLHHWAQHNHGDAPKESVGAAR